MMGDSGEAYLEGQGDLLSRSMENTMEVLYYLGFRVMGTK